MITATAQGSSAGFKARRAKGSSVDAGRSAVRQTEQVQPLSTKVFMTLGHCVAAWQERPFDAARKALHDAAAAPRPDVGTGHCTLPNAVSIRSSCSLSRCLQRPNRRAAPSCITQE
jgi:hypothetical protein